MSNYEFKQANYQTKLMSYDKEWSRVISAVEIDIKDYKTFCKVVEAVSEILREECSDYRTFTGTIQFGCDKDEE